MRIDNPSISGSLSFIGGTNSISPTSVSLTGSLSGTFEGSFSSTAVTSISGAFDSVSQSLAADISLNRSSINSLNSASTSYLLNTTDTLDGDLTVTGKITAQEFHTEFVSASIIYESGSTQFGDSVDDVHTFTGTGSFDTVGIGTDGPSSGKLEIQQTGTAAGLWVQTGGTTDSYTVADFRTGTNNPALAIKGDSSSVFGGNVGIGVSPSTKLHVLGTTRFDSNNINDPDGNSRTNYPAAHTFTHFSEDNGVAIFGGNGDFTGTTLMIGEEITASSAFNFLKIVADINDTPVDMFVVRGDGRVGIGTNDPATILHIEDSTTAAIQLENTSEADSFIDFINPSRTFRVGYDDSIDSFKVAVTNFNDSSLVINSSGNVGINTTSPAADLHLYNTVGNTVLRLEADGDNNDEGDAAQIHFITDGGLRTGAITGGNAPGELAPTNLNALNLSAFQIRFLTSEGVQDFELASERMRILPDGNIVLGANGNQYGLVTIRQSGTSNDSGLGVVNSTNTRSARLWTDGTNSYLSSGATGTASLVLNEGGGNVGIGTTSPDSSLHIYKTLAASETTLLKLSFNVDGDLSQQKSFIDFALLDTNTNETPQVRIGAEVGQNGNADTQIKEGSGAFVVYTNNADTTTGEAGASLAERMRVDYKGDVGIGTTNIATRLSIQSSASGKDGTFLWCSDSSFAAGASVLSSARSASSGYVFLYGISSRSGMTSGTGQDIEFVLRGDGQAFADGSWNGGGADYAEYFETLSGNTINRGITVVVDGDKVRPATESDDTSKIIGVVRPKGSGNVSSAVGNSAWNKWDKKYLTDDFGEYIREEHNVLEWTESIIEENGNATTKKHSYESHNIPVGVTVPEDAIVKTHDENGNRFDHRKLNPNFNETLEYIPREQRDEWVIVGLLGQVPILKGQPVNPNWIKMKDISETVELWFIK